MSDGVESRDTTVRGSVCVVRRPQCLAIVGITAAFAELLLLAAEWTLGMVSVVLSIELTSRQSGCHQR